MSADEKKRLSGDEFIKKASSSGLTDRQAQAFFDRRVANVPRQEVADAIGTTKSNVDNLERIARQKITQAHKLVTLVESVGVSPSEL